VLPLRGARRRAPPRRAVAFARVMTTCAPRRASSVRAAFADADLGTGHYDGLSLHAAA